MRFVIVTGMSGAGKSTALKMLEDVGYYCVDNLPVMLVTKFVELAYSGDKKINNIAWWCNTTTLVHTHKATKYWSVRWRCSTIDCLWAIL